MNGPVRMGCSPARWVAFGLGSGLLPVAPGTFGTLLAIPLVLLLSFLMLGSMRSCVLRSWDWQ